MRLFLPKSTVSAALLIGTICLVGTLSDAFVVPAATIQRSTIRIPSAGIGKVGGQVGEEPLTVLAAQKKRRRKRKKVAETASSAPAAPAAQAAPESKPKSSSSTASSAKSEAADILAAEMAAFDLGADGFVEDDDEASSLPLPDIREARARRKEKELEEEEEKAREEFKPKVDRRDLEAMKKLLEAQPFADADETLFEEEEYGTVSALLGEKAKPFLGIGSGPLQVGHFIGSLAIMLMAFIEYPGFPLTNLPTPLRDCFAGGLATIYAVNAVLAIFATFKAGERGQSALLWGVKTFAVGGLAYDQLSQLPTTAEIERRKSIKGKRALKKR